MQATLTSPRPAQPVTDEVRVKLRRKGHEAAGAVWMEVERSMTFAAFLQAASKKLGASSLALPLSALPWPNSPSLQDIPFIILIEIYFFSEVNWTRPLS